MTSRRGRLLEILARQTCRHPWLFIAAGLLLAAGSVAITREWLAFKVSRDDLISQDHEYFRISQQYENEFGDRVECVSGRRGSVHGPSLPARVAHDKIPAPNDRSP